MVQHINQSTTTQPADDKTLAAISVKAQIMATWGEGTDAMLSHVEQHLGQVYNAAEAVGDQSTMLSVAESWQSTQALAAQAKNAVDAFLTAAAIVDPVVMQRNAAVQELADLTKAIENWDQSNPLVEGLIDGVADLMSQVQDETETTITEIYAESTLDELTANAQVNLGFEWEDAASLIDCLYSDDHPSIESINGWIDALTSLRDSLAGQVV